MLNYKIITTHKVWHLLLAKDCLPGYIPGRGSPQQMGFLGMLLIWLFSRKPKDLDATVSWLYHSFEDPNDLYLPWSEQDSEDKGGVIFAALNPLALSFVSVAELSFPLPSPVCLFLFSPWLWQREAARQNQSSGTPRSDVKRFGGASRGSSRCVYAVLVNCV